MDVESNPGPTSPRMVGIHEEQNAYLGYEFSAFSTATKSMNWLNHNSQHTSPLVPLFVVLRASVTTGISHVFYFLWEKIAKESLEVAEREK